ncbi:hypothetical protein VPH35_087404 [Triticum aestivum]|uniref:DUF6598 domain-containing protein n=1 Tax=Triticum turgidum subsp. durum TaxID=4567 RepID=A0A9R0WWY5_TRITD|nr:uncharacterized protein LOC123108563 [Triticum aestivum]VAI25971.1 unnamed protein product [Triticum turgidum subsp. durum]
MATRMSKEELAAYQPRPGVRCEKAAAEFLARRKKEMESEPEESRTDLNAYEAGLYHVFWEQMFGKDGGSYEDITMIPPMAFTDRGCKFADLQSTIQIFSIKVKETTGGLKWPLDVYGMVAVRDVVDHNRNVIFHRERDNCQIITTEDPYLAVTGPTRAVVVSVHPIYFDVNLKVKGDTKSEDKDLSFLAACYSSNGPWASCLFDRAWTSKLSTLKFTFGHLVDSVEATVSVKLIRGTWPHGYRGVFTVETSGIPGKVMLLLDSCDGKLPVDGDGRVKLSRRVVCVEFVQPLDGLGRANLRVSVEALCISGKDKDEKVKGKKDNVKFGVDFLPKKRGRSRQMIEILSCEIEVTVVWSLMSTFKSSYKRAIASHLESLSFI